MFNFTYQNPTAILFGEGQIAAIKDRIPADAKILLTYGGGSIKSNGVYDQVIDALSGREIVEFGGIEANPHYETLMEAVKIVRDQGLNFLLAVGGGSVVDGTKFIAAASRYEGDDPWKILSEGLSLEDALPVGCVLTLPATGTESNGNAVVTRAATKTKLGFSSPLMYPQFAVLDPTTTYSLPPKQIANGVVDAFVHIMEQYMTYPVDAAVQDRFSEALLITLIEEGPKALANPQDYAVRANVMWAATMALNGLIGVGVPQDWATHGIGHELTALHGLDHAQTLAIVLPALLTVLKANKSEKLMQMGRRVFNLTQDGDALVDATINAIVAFFETMGVPTRFVDYGLDGSSAETIIDRVKQNQRLPIGEHGNIDEDTIRQILNLAR